MSNGIIQKSQKENTREIKEINMGFYSQVQIVSEKKAFPLFEEVFKKHNINVSITQKEDIHTILLDWVKWYPDFDEVKEVDEICGKLNTEAYNEEEGYGYKIIILNEDNTTEELSNERGECEFSDFEVICDISNPYR